ncbi:MAG: MBL fold metallo-hydrolase [Firmicutes bacterium]|nr:MBL fold metallo-hydrolase [Bacillota bacterium]
MQLTVLGCYGPYPVAGESCSGYLLQDEETTVLLDCGNGVLSQLLYYCEPANLDAIILSHLHSDHIGDIKILRYMLLNMPTNQSLTVYAPSEPTKEFELIPYKHCLQVKPLSTTTKIKLGRMYFSFTAGVHSVPSYIATVEMNGKKLVYSGDTEYFDGLNDVVKGADLFLCEANYLRQDIEKGHANHLAAFQAAQAAAAGGVKRLVLTHHHPDRNPLQALAEAQQVFPPTELARTGSVYFL